MDENLINLVPAGTHVERPTRFSAYERIIEFYEEAGIDYAHWSRGLNMHLGFYASDVNPFDREAMLERMNLEVASRLRIESAKSVHLVDLGCGMGAVARSVARKYPNVAISGITLAPSQAAIASYANEQEGLNKQIDILTMNYTCLPFEEGSVDGVWAVESACYAAGPGKSDLVREMARVIRPGGRFVITDCFVVHPEREFGGFAKLCYEEVCRDWALSEMATLDYFTNALTHGGFCDILVEDISWRAAPSLAHAPAAVAGFVLRKILAGEQIKRHSINNLKASMLALLLGLNRSKFRYCFVSGTRS